MRAKVQEGGFCDSVHYQPYRPSAHIFPWDLNAVFSRRREPRRGSNSLDLSRREGKKEG